MKLGQNDFVGPPLPPGWSLPEIDAKTAVDLMLNSPPAAKEPLTIDITGGREMSWWEANKGWALPVGFILLFMAANR